METKRKNGHDLNLCTQVAGLRIMLHRHIALDHGNVINYTL